MKIIGNVESTLYGNALMAEYSHGSFLPVGKTESHTANWEEISNEEWMKNFSK